MLYSLPDTYSKAFINIAQIGILINLNSGEYTRIMKIAAVSDIHSPKYLREFVESLKIRKYHDIALVLLAGDIIDKGAVSFMRPVINAIKKTFKSRIIGIYGNEEYDSVKNDIKREFNDVIWLDDETYFYETSDIKVAIVGSRGVLDRPTWWQQRNIPNIREIYLARIKKIESLLRAVPKNYKKILLTHYSPTYATLVGEDKRVWPMLGSRRLEKIILNTRPKIVIHGHAHRSVKVEAWLRGVRIINVAFPARKEVTVIDFSEGLEKYLI